MKKYSQDFTKIKDVERLLIDIGRILAHFKEGSDKEGLKLVSVSAMLVYTRQKKYRSSFYS